MGWLNLARKHTHYLIGVPYHTEEHKHYLLDVSGSAWLAEKHNHYLLDGHVLA